MDDAPSDRVELAEPIFPRPVPGERYLPPKFGSDEEARIKERMRKDRVQVRPDTVAHAREAEEIRRFLRRCGLKADREVAPTTDGRGIVRLDFASIRKLVTAVDEETWDDAGWWETGDPEG